MYFGFWSQRRRKEKWNRADMFAGAEKNNAYYFQVDFKCHIYNDLKVWMYDTTRHSGVFRHEDVSRQMDRLTLYRAALIGCLQLLNRNITPLLSVKTFLFFTTKMIYWLLLENIYTWLVSHCQTFLHSAAEEGLTSGWGPWRLSFGHNGACLGFCWGPQTGLHCSTPNGRW